MSNRDEFPQKTKDALRLRARNLCSFRGCKRPTSGPSHESPDDVSMTGKAAHTPRNGGPLRCAPPTAPLRGSPPQPRNRGITNVQTPTAAG